MKRLLLLVLFSGTMYSQSDATMHFYAGSARTLGSELLIHVNDTDSFYLGGGFGGTTNAVYVPRSPINDYDKQYIVNSFDEEWCSLYGVTSFGFFKAVMIKFKGGLAVYNRKVNFENDNGFKYVKLDKALFRPLLGASAMYSITEDVGVEVGLDTFNHATLGFTILF